MVVCKFFQQGNCRYGQNCRFDHIYGSKYSYHAAPQQQTPSTVTVEQLAQQVQSDVQAALKGGQWLLSCYAPFKEKPVLPGLADLSPEEARLFIYEAKANNNIDTAVAYINSLIQETRVKYEQLLQPTESMLRIYRSIYKGEPVSSPFTAQNQGFENNSATSIFRSAAQSTSGFGQTNANNSLFGQCQNNAFSNQQNLNILGNQSDPAKSIFASANQNVQSVFGQPSNNIFQSQNQDAAKSIFAHATQNVFGQSPPRPTQSIFGAAPPSQTSNVFATQNVDQSDVFKNSTFSSAPTSGSVFAISDRPTTNVFGTVHSDHNVSEGSIYSRMEDLSPSDVEAYESPTFKLGFVPELPPPSNLCR